MANDVNAVREGPRVACVVIYIRYSDADNLHMWLLLHCREDRCECLDTRVRSEVAAYRPAVGIARKEVLSRYEDLIGVGTKPNALAPDLNEQLTTVRIEGRLPPPCLW